ncbi:peptidase family M20/M25/M40 [Apiospora phragmitis]|uniref:Peptidase family M20/M25/M40 n=1 Tax=Apiospora phragmitis TaxID=2905665 RepID=A0ABR1X5H8_9PEZI
MATYEKLPLVQPSAQDPRVTTSKRLRVPLLAILSLSVLALLWTHRVFGLYRECEKPHTLPLSAQCPQVDPLLPKRKTGALTQMEEYLDSSAFRNETISRLSGAVQIPTQSYDGMGPIGEDPRWDTMYDLSAYFEKTFPLVHKTLKLDKINTHGLLYTWQGSNKSLKPLVLMAHQDVVPVAEATIGQWTYPPFSGYYERRVDLGSWFQRLQEPSRWTLVLSFGFDEETLGGEGAGHLAAELLERYGKDGAAMIVDEGAGLTTAFGTTFATPAVGEKGAIDVEVTVRMPGGHSSIPPAHTGIGVMAEFIALIEANLYEPHFHSENPFLGLLQCGAAHGPEFPPEWKKLLGSGTTISTKNKDKLAREVAKFSDEFKYLFTTSVAVDIINGGVKSNALPERTTALINHRVNVGDSPFDVQAKIAKLASSVTEKYNLTLHAFDDQAETPSSMTLKSSRPLKPAPVTPTEVGSLTPYAVLSGTTRALYNKDIIMAPGLSTGNTDTLFYWDLTKHIFRYQAGWDPKQEGLGGIHTVDEHISVLAHTNTVKWISTLVRNMDEAGLP